ncbi:DUF4056 domain-containing protein, partial [Planctomycetota bacterium]
YPTPTLAMRFIDVNDLGKHGYATQRGEGNGIVYTCRGGHIDIAHVRANADWVRYVAERVFAYIRHGETSFRFETYIEPSLYHSG